MELLDLIRHRALVEAQRLPPECFRICGMWTAEFVCQPAPGERVFANRVVLVQTKGEGCCFTEEEVSIQHDIVGKSALGFVPSCRAVHIAMLDSVFDVVKRAPDDIKVLDGNRAAKAGERAEIIAQEVDRLLAGKSSPVVVNVGVVGSLIRKLRERGYKLLATDRDRSLIGSEVEGVQVESAEHTLDYVRQADVAVVTGMTLSTNTLGDIIKAKKQAENALIVFAQTGAHLSSLYTDFGADVVFSEPFPFYDFNGRNVIGVYRSREG